MYGLVHVQKKPIRTNGQDHYQFYDVGIRSWCYHGLVFLISEVCAADRVKQEYDHGRLGLFSHLKSLRRKFVLQTREANWEQWARPTPFTALPTLVWSNQGQQQHQYVQVQVQKKEKICTIADIFIFDIADIFIFDMQVIKSHNLI